jgi:SdpI/YhfL family protein
MRPQTLLLSTFLVSGLLLCAIAIPLIREQIPRNRWYGFRVPKTLASDQVWYAANRFAGRDLLATGLIIAAGTLALWPFAGRLSVDAVSWWGLALTLVPLSISLYRGFQYLRTL